MKRRILGMLIIPIALGGIGLIAINANNAHAETAPSSASQTVDAPEPGDTPDAKDQADVNDKADANDPADAKNANDKDVPGQADTETNDD
jgi:hypothetical protein